MKKRTFYRLLLLVVGIGLALTVAHFVYVLYAYQHGSIIYFIGEELWG